MASVAVDDAGETDAKGGQRRVLRFIEDSVQVVICHGRQVIFRLREDGVELIEQQCFVRDSERFDLLVGVPMAGSIISRVWRHMEALMPAIGDPQLRSI